MKSLLLWIPCVMACSSSLLAASPVMPEFGLPMPLRAEISSDVTPAYDFRGIVALSNCSGSLVRFDDSQDADRAMVLSNGHCFGLIDPGRVIQNQSQSRSFDVLGAEAQKLGTVRADRILYATMTKTDMILYQLRETYAEIRDRFDVEALTLSREGPELGTEIEVLSGYWKRGYSCSVEAIAPTLREGRWSFVDSIRYTSSCNTIGGTSGSPVLASGTRLVVAVNNTGNTAGRRCEVNNPCEVNEDGSVVYQKGYSYAQQTSWIYSCRNAEGVIDLAVSGCLLPR
jgi:hypothetical protein